MKAVFNYELQDWNNIEVLQRNRLCTRPFYTGYADRESAAAMHREKSGNYKLLNGSWDFTYYENPLETPEDFMKPEFDSSGWGKMPVPGHWQLNGFGYPHYNDAISLFPRFRTTIRQALTAIFSGWKRMRRKNICSALTGWKALTMYG